MEKIKILLADDIRSTLKFYDKVLGDQFFEKKFAQDGIQVYECYKAWNPDIIVLDMMMPVLDGYQTLKKIRGNSEFQGDTVTIIMATSQKAKTDVVKCAALGIQGYIVKPFKLTEFEDQILNSYAKKAPEIVSSVRMMKSNSSWVKASKTSVLG